VSGSRVGAALAIIAVIISMRVCAADEAYVWQRRWTPAVREALGASREIVDGVRILVAQAGRDNRWIETQADPGTLAGDARRRVAVIRFDGAGSPPDAPVLGAYLDRLLERWRAAGAAFDGVEIDYDCGDARLADYTARLTAIRARLPRAMRLSVTALPAWLGSADLDDVLAASDEAVLQVHAVRSPEHGLFDADLAERWSRAFAERTRKPFRIALPTYGSRVDVATDGRIRSIESEVPIDVTDSDDARELESGPAAVIDLLKRLRRTPPAQWSGVVWFRLPVAGDRRAWTLDTLRQVIAGRTPVADVAIELRAADNGALDIVAVNRGGIATRPPAFRLVGATCATHDASMGWSVDSTFADQPRLIPIESLRIPPGRSDPVGWVRCTSQPQVVPDVAPAGKGN